MVFSSSEKSTALMRKYGFKVEDGAPDFKLDFYVDGADEFDQNKCLIKGGGGAPPPPFMRHLFWSNSSAPST